MNTLPPKRKRSSWFAFYPDDFSGGTRSMSLAGRGAFIELLGYQFANGSIPADDRTLCRITGAFPDEWSAVKEEVLAKFEFDEDGNLVNLRMQKEREEREEIRSKRVDASRKGNEKRWQNYPKWDRKSVPNGIANGNVLRIASTATSTATSSSTTKSESKSKTKVHLASKARPQTREEFDAFLQEVGLYPRDAEATWNKFEGNGWTNGGKKIACWKSTVRAWKASGYMLTQKSPSDYEPQWPRAQSAAETAPEEEDDLMAKLLRLKEVEAREAAGDHPDYWTEEELEKEEAGCF